jgi:hypothetical protein
VNVRKCFRDILAAYWSYESGRNLSSTSLGVAPSHHSRLLRQSCSLVCSHDGNFWLLFFKEKFCVHSTINFTFMSRYIVIDFFLSNQPDALIIPILFCYKTTRFEHHLCPSSGVLYCTFGAGKFHAGFWWPLPSRFRMELRSILTLFCVVCIECCARHSIHTTAWNTCCHNTAKLLTMYFTDNSTKE